MRRPFHPVNVTKDPHQKKKKPRETVYLFYVSKQPVVNEQNSRAFLIDFLQNYDL